MNAAAAHRDHPRNHPLTTAAAPQGESGPQARSALERLIREVNELDGALNTLVLDRLGPVLRPAPPRCVNDGSAPAGPPRSELADQLLAVSASVGSMKALVIDVLERLDL